MRARGGRQAVGVHAAAVADGAREHRRETEAYARQAMVSSAQAHDRAATLLEQMATAHPEEADLHLQSAARHRKWAENDRNLAEEYAPWDSGPDRR